MAHKIPLVPVQLVLRYNAVGKAHDMLRKLLPADDTVKSSPDKHSVVKILIERVTPGSDHRKLLPKLEGYPAHIHIQAFECGPFGMAEGSTAQVICTGQGAPLAPIIDFAKIKGGFCTPGGYRAGFESENLIVVKSYQDGKKTMISRLSPIVDGDEAWIKDEMLFLCNTGDPLPEEFACFQAAYDAVQTRIHEVSTDKLHYAK